MLRFVSFVLFVHFALYFARYLALYFALYSVFDFASGLLSECSLFVVPIASVAQDQGL